MELTTTAIGTYQQHLPSKRIFQVKAINGTGTRLKNSMDEIFLVSECEPLRPFDCDPAEMAEILTYVARSQLRECLELLREIFDPEALKRSAKLMEASDRAVIKQMVEVTQ